MQSIESIECGQCNNLRKTKRRKYLINNVVLEISVKSVVLVSPGESNQTQSNTNHLTGFGNRTTWNKKLL